MDRHHRTASSSTGKCQEFAQTVNIKEKMSGNLQLMNQHSEYNQVLRLEFQSQRKKGDGCRRGKLTLSPQLQREAN